MRANDTTKPKHRREVSKEKTVSFGPKPSGYQPRLSGAKQVMFLVSVFRNRLCTRMRVHAQVRVRACDTFHISSYGDGSIHVLVPFPSFIRETPPPPFLSSNCVPPVGAGREAGFRHSWLQRDIRPFPVSTVVNRAARIGTPARLRNASWHTHTRALDRRGLGRRAAPGDPPPRACPGCVRAAPCCHATRQATCPGPSGVPPESSLSSQSKGLQSA